MAGDDKQLYVVRRDISGGMNTRQHGSIIGETQCTLLYNVDLGVPGQATKRPGTMLSKDLSNDTGLGAFGFEPRGGTNELLVVEDTSLWGCTVPDGGGDDTYTEHKSDLTLDLSTTMVKATCSGTNGDVAIVSNGTEVFQMLQNHTMTDLVDTNTSPPKTTAMTFYRNRLWALKSNLLYWSAALPSTYLAQFDRTSNNYNMTVGEERAVIGVRDMGLLCFGADAVYGINPSVTPAATDLPEKILDIGCVAKNTVCQVADDVFFLSSDGVRGVFRTQQDKLQMGQSYPLSYALKDEFDNLSWANISKACAIYFDNKYFIAVPSGETYNNRVWVFYPANNSWVVITGWNVGAWAKVKISGQEQLFYIDSNDGSVYRAWYGYTDGGTTTINGTAINYQEEDRKEDLGQPLVKKAGGEVLVRAKASGDYDISIYAQFDDAGYNLLGTINLSGNLITFPLTFPVSFLSPRICYKKFHLESYGEWYKCQLKIQHNNTNSNDEITILERAIMSYPTEYIAEEEA